jgi:DNA-directed RNA polymerase II subunit RPB1
MCRDPSVVCACFTVVLVNMRVCVLLQANRPVMGIVQDTLLGSQKITKRDVFIERDLMMNMVMWMKHWEGYIPPPAVMLPTKGQPGL